MSGVHVAAERWIRPLPSGRGVGKIDPLGKLVLGVLWGCVDWSIERAPVGRERPWISREEIAAELGAEVSAVRKQTAKLTALGWIKWEARRWSLAWGSPFESGQQGPEPTPVAVDPYSPPSRPLQSTESTPVAVESDPCNGPDQGSQELNQERHQVADRPPDENSANGSSPSATASRGTSEREDSSPPSEQEPRGSTPPSPSKPTRRRRKHPPAQAGLDLGDGQPPDDVAELLALHERLRAEAYAHHEMALPKWPAAKSAKGKSLRTGLAHVLRQRGREWCERMLHFRKQCWLDDPSGLPYSAQSVWTKPSIEHALRFMDGPARASPRRLTLLSCPPPAEPPPYIPPDDDLDMEML